MERGRGTLVEKPLHDTDSRHTPPVRQRLELNAFFVTEESHGTDLDAVKARKGRLRSAQPQRTAILQLRANEGLVDSGESFVVEYGACSPQESKAAVGFAVH